MSLWIIIVVVFVLWIGAYLFYLATSNEQRDIAHEMDDVRALLDKKKD